VRQRFARECGLTRTSLTSTLLAFRYLESGRIASFAAQSVSTQERTRCRQTVCALGRTPDRRRRFRGVCKKVASISGSMRWRTARRSSATSLEMAACFQELIYRVGRGAAVQRGLHELFGGVGD
jgi:hypothetical protein